MKYAPLGIIMVSGIAVATVLACKVRSNNVSSLRDAGATIDSLGNWEQMDLVRLKNMAFNMCQVPYSEPAPPAVPQLDPPAAGGKPGDLGLVYAEELAITGSPFFKKNDMLLIPRPRAAVNKIPMLVYANYYSGGSYQRVNWNSIAWNYTDPQIQPPLAKDNQIATLTAAIPSPGQVLTELLVGKCQAVNGATSCPSLFDLRSSGYVRFAGFPPQAYGASWRVGAHSVFGLGQGQTPLKEDFPVIRALFTTIKDGGNTTNAFALVESNKFCTAMTLDLNNDTLTNAVVDSYWYTRDNFDWTSDPNTGLVAYSSMVATTEGQTPGDQGAEAHDSDTVRLTSVDSSSAMQNFVLDPSSGQPVAEGAVVPSLTAPTGQLRRVEIGDRPIVAWSLANEHRDAWRFTDYANSLGASNYDKRDSYRVEVLESSVKTGLLLFVAPADGSFGNNIVALSQIRENIGKSTSVDDVVHFKYKTTAYTPPWDQANNAAPAASCAASDRICRIPAHDNAVAAVQTSPANAGSSGSTDSGGAVGGPSASGSSGDSASAGASGSGAQGSGGDVQTVPVTGTSQGGDAVELGQQNSNCNSLGGSVYADGMCRCDSDRTTPVFKLHGAPCPGTTAAAAASSTASPAAQPAASDDSDLAGPAQQNANCTAQGGSVHLDGMCRCNTDGTTPIFKLHGAPCPAAAN